MYLFFVSASLVSVLKTLQCSSPVELPSQPLSPSAKFDVSLLCVTWEYVMWGVLSHMMAKGWDDGLCLRMCLLVKFIWTENPVRWQVPLRTFPIPFGSSWQHSWSRLRLISCLRPTRSRYLELWGCHCRVHSLVYEHHLFSNLNFICTLHSNYVKKTWWLT